MQKQKTQMKVVPKTKKRPPAGAAKRRNRAILQARIDRARIFATPEGEQDDLLWEFAAHNPALVIED